MLAEDGSLLTVLILGIVWFGALAIVFGVYSLYVAMTQDNRLQATDNEAALCKKKRRIGRKTILQLGSVSHALLLLTYIYLLSKIGTFARTSDGYTINYSLFAGEAVAAVPLAFALSFFFWFEGNKSRFLLAAVMALVMCALALGPLTNVDSKRNVMFASAVLLQLGTVAVLFFAGHGLLGRMFNARGAIITLALIGAYVLYDTFWFIGYENAPHASTVESMSQRWKSHLAFFMAAALAHTATIVMAYLFYAPRKAAARCYEPGASDIAPQQAPEVLKNGAEMYSMAGAVNLQGFAGV